MSDHFVVFGIGQITVCLHFSYIYKIEKLVGLNFVFYLPSFAILDNAAINVCVQVFVWT